MSAASPSFAPRRTAHLLLAGNANASGVTSELLASVRAELERLGAGVETLVTGSAQEWLEIVAEDDRRVVVVGGDGTVHAAARATSLQPEVAVIPAGRANNIARSLGIPLGVREAARLAVDAHARPIDLVEAETPRGRRVTVEAVSLGFLAEARSYYHQRNSSHLTSALVAGAHALAEFKPLRVRLTTPEGVDELVVEQLFVANLPLYGFHLHVAPRADPTDELLDVVAIEGTSRIALPALIGRLHSRHGINGRKVHRLRVPWVRVDTRDSSPAIADSFDLGPGPLVAWVVPRAFRVVRP